MAIPADTQLPGATLKVEKMPGHWLLARLGKRVLRPGGLGLTKAMLAEAGIDAADDIVELAPGLGLTAQLMLERKPHSYVGVERDAEAAAFMRQRLPHAPDIRVLTGTAEATGLPAESASLVVAEAMLTLNAPAHKQAIAAEAFRILRPGGRYAIHELAIVPDDVASSVKTEIETTLSRSIHVGARPLTEAEWRALLTGAGFVDLKVHQAPMHLLKPARILADEGLWRTLKFVRNVLADSDARRRVLEMRGVFNKHAAHIRGIALVGTRPR
jgi:SAM-dependent methyltransferase